jgi:hypothetical protein
VRGDQEASKQPFGTKSIPSIEVGAAPAPDASPAARQPGSLASQPPDGQSTEPAHGLAGEGGGEPAPTRGHGTRVRLTVVE